MMRIIFRGQVSPEGKCPWVKGVVRGFSAMTTHAHRKKSLRFYRELADLPADFIRGSHKKTPYIFTFDSFRHKGRNTITFTCHNPHCSDRAPIVKTITRSMPSSLAFMHTCGRKNYVHINFPSAPGSSPGKRKLVEPVPFNPLFVKNYFYTTCVGCGEKLKVPYQLKSDNRYPGRSSLYHAACDTMNYLNIVAPRDYPRRTDLNYPMMLECNSHIYFGTVRDISKSGMNVGFEDRGETLEAVADYRIGDRIRTALLFGGRKQEAFYRNALFMFDNQNGFWKARNETDPIKLSRIRQVQKDKKDTFLELERFARIVRVDHDKKAVSVRFDNVIDDTSNAKYNRLVDHSWNPPGRFPDCAGR